MTEEGKWMPIEPDYKGEPFEPFNVRWKHVDGTMSPIGSGAMETGSVLVYWQEGGK